MLYWNLIDRLKILKKAMGRTETNVVLKYFKTISNKVDEKVEPKQMLYWNLFIKHWRSYWFASNRNKCCIEIYLELHPRSSLRASRTETNVVLKFKFCNSAFSFSFRRTETNVVLKSMSFSVVMGQTRSRTETNVVLKFKTQSPSVCFAECRTETNVVLKFYFYP